MLRVVFRIALVIAVLRGIGAFVSRRRTEGDAASDVFSIASVFGGENRACRASALRRGEVLTCCGGIELDLREATLDPGGAELVLRAYLGGIQVLVPEAWRVVVADHASAGGIDVHVSPDEDLPGDAPVLHIEAFAAFGGVQVSTDPD